MSRIRLLLSFLCVAFAVAVALMKPLPSRAGNNGAAPAMPAPTGAEAAGAQPTVKAKRRSTQLHLPFGKRVVDFAKHFVGTRYVYGGSSPRSRLRLLRASCATSTATSGSRCPTRATRQFDLGRRVGRWALRPGDLVFFDGLGHVGIYVGNGRFIHAPHTGTRVRIETLAGWYGARFVGGRRLRSAAAALLDLRRGDDRRVRRTDAAGGRAQARGAARRAAGVEPLLREHRPRQRLHGLQPDPARRRRR